MEVKMFPFHAGARIGEHSFVQAVTLNRLLWGGIVCWILCSDVRSGGNPNSDRSKVESFILSYTLSTQKLCLQQTFSSASLTRRGTPLGGQQAVARRFVDN